MTRQVLLSRKIVIIGVILFIGMALFGGPGRSSAEGPSTATDGPASLSNDLQLPRESAQKKTNNQPALQTGLWTQVASPDGPFPRVGHAMAYDSLRGRVVLFGGGFLVDTWEWDGEVWVQVSNNGPSPRTEHALVYDSQRRRVVLFGGQTLSGYLGDTWEWDGTIWTQVATTGPPARSGHAMVYDDVRKRIVLYGGYDSLGKSDMWERSGTVWSTITNSVSPGIRYSHAMAFDNMRQRSVLFGGMDANGARANDTWEWDGSAWTQEATTGPSPRFGHAMEFDKTCGKVILFGGFDNNFQGDTWAWNGAIWFQIANSGPTQRFEHAMSYDSIRGVIVLFGGAFGPLTASPSPSQFPSPSPSPSPRFLGDTWEWRSPCDDEAAELDEHGEVVLPPNVDPKEPITDEEVIEDRGNVATLYPSYDTSTDVWYKQFLCNPSVGGTIPPEASDPNLTKQLEDQGITGATPEEIATYLSTGEELIGDAATHETERLSNAPSVGGPYTPPTEPHCTVKGCKYIFGGRDIVFVHGLRTNPLINKIVGTDAGALTEWPQDRNEFYGTGYWKQGAESYWAEHIKKFMTDRGIRNRYLIVAYPSTQRLEIGVQAILAQISDAIRFETGVVDPSGHNDKSKFGTPSFVIVSHSTGGLAADVAMRAAEKHPNLGVDYIPKLCKAHVALQGAFSGSRFATGAILLANYLNRNDPTPPWLCPLVKLTLLAINSGGANNAMLNCPLDYTAVNSSILVDLVPLVSQLKWGSFVRDTPVRTVTVVGGHPSYLAPLKNIFHPGFDDGVLSINSQVANPNSALFWPSGYRRLSVNLLPVRVFDMGVAGTGNQPNSGLHSPLRAIGYFVDQVGDPKLNPLNVVLHPFLVATGATPYVSPTGMLQPVGGEFDLNGGFNPLRRYPNHFSFIQSASDHYKGSTGDGGFNMPYYRDTLLESNFEETRVLTDNSIYNGYEMPFYSNDDQPILSHEPAVTEEIRGRKKTFTIFKKKKTVWFWKRTYHLMAGWREKVQMDYVQDLVLRDTGYACPPPIAADDCNRNNTPDECDIANGTSKDCNRNGIPDECENITIPPPVITQGPVNTIVMVGQSVTFSVTATSTVPVSYQWRKDGVNLNDNARISGTRSSSLTINPTNLSDNGFYDVVLTVCDSVTSGPAKLIVKVDCPKPPGCPLVISRFRLNGPAGSADEFVEIFNSGDIPVKVSTCSSDPNGNANGIGVFTSAGQGVNPIFGQAANVSMLACQIPGSTVIAGRGYYLCGGKNYSLGKLGNNGGSLHSVPDQTIGAASAVIQDIPDDAGLALLNIGSNIVTQCVVGNLGCCSGFNFPDPGGGGSGGAAVYDRVGFGPYGPGSPRNVGPGIYPANLYPSLASLYCEGTCLLPVGDASIIVKGPGMPCLSVAPAPGISFPVSPGGTIGAVPVCYGESGQYEILRRQTTFNPNVGTLHRDTDNNPDDFILVSPNPTTNSVGLTISGIAPVTSVLGAAGPHNLSAPGDLPGITFPRAPFAECLDQLKPPNAERVFPPEGPPLNIANDPLGTFTLRFRYTNNLPNNITGLRLRVDDLSTLCGGQVSVSTTGTGEARNLQSLPICQGAGTDGGVYTAILKAVNSLPEVLNVCSSLRIVNGTVIEDLSVPGGALGEMSPFAGGIDSTLIVNPFFGPPSSVGTGVSGGMGVFATIVGTTPANKVLFVQIKFGVVKSGRFKVLITPEGR